MTDKINSPAHYNMGGVECKEAMKAALGRSGYVDYCRGAAMKYIWRMKWKDSPIENMMKAEWYIREAIHELQELEASTLGLSVPEVHGVRGVESGECGGLPLEPTEAREGDGAESPRPVRVSVSGLP